MNTRQYTLLSVGILVAWQAAVLFPFRYVTGFQERDSYRMLVGIVDSLARGTYFDNAMLYNREISFGYYGGIYALTAGLAHAPASILQVMNDLSIFCAILFVLPFFVVVDALFDRATAISSSLLLCAVPVWWNTALYAHPITPAMLLCFTALALLARWGGPDTPRGVRLAALILLALALSCRFDLVLLFPAVVAVLTYRLRYARAVVTETAFYCGGAVLLFALAQALLPTVRGGPAPESILELLQQGHDPRRMIGRIREVRDVIGGGFTPPLFALMLLAPGILWRRRDAVQMLFLFGVIAVNLVFWWPNPSPPRHYLPMVPAVAVAAAVTGLRAMALTSISPVARPWLLGMVLALVSAGASILLDAAPRRLQVASPFKTRFVLDDYRRTAGRIAADIMALSDVRPPMVILCDSNFVIAEMGLRGAAGLTVNLEIFTSERARMGFDIVRYKGNTFVMPEQAWDTPSIEEALDRLDLYHGYPVVVDPYNGAIAYHGARPRVPLPAISARAPALGSHLLGLR